MNTTTPSSFHSADVRFTPPGGYAFLGPYPRDTAALRSSASRCPCFGLGKRGVLWGKLGGGEAVLRTRTLADIAGVEQEEKGQPGDKKEKGSEREVGGGGLRRRSTCKMDGLHQGRLSETRIDSLSG